MGRTDEFNTGVTGDSLENRATIFQDQVHPQYSAHSLLDLYNTISSSDGLSERDQDRRLLGNQLRPTSNGESQNTYDGSFLLTDTAPDVGSAHGG